MPIIRLLLLCGLLLGAAAPTRADAIPRPLFMGTAPVVGVYFPAGGAICAVVNSSRAQNGLR